MIYTKDNPVGIDYQIGKIQSELYTQLVAAWSLSDTDYNSHPRCYRNIRNGQYYPEVYTGSGEYKEVFLDDTLKVLSFFGVGENTKVDKPKMTDDVHLIFFVNLTKLYSETDRMDLEARQAVHQALLSSGSLNITGIVTGVANVLSEYTGWRTSQGLEQADIHPWHSFRFNMEVTYTRNNICNYTLTT